MTLKFGVIGVGHFGKHYARLLQEIKEVELTAVASPGIASRKLILPRSVKKFSDPGLLIKDPDIDCVVIATPVSSHYKLAVSALKAGKHVLLEKPMTRTLREAKKLQKVVAQSSLVFMVGHQYLYNDFIRHLKEKLDQKILGKISHIFAEHLYPGPIRPDVGCFWDAAGHELAILQYLFGPLTVKEVKGKTVEIGGRGDDFSVAEIIFIPPRHARAGFTNELTVTMVVSRFYPEKTRRFSIVGDKGAVIFDDQRDEKLKFYFYSRILDVSKMKTSTPKIAAAEPLRNELEHFIYCAKNKKTPLTNIEHGVSITEMLHKIYSHINKS